MKKTLTVLLLIFTLLLLVLGRTLYLEKVIYRCGKRTYQKVKSFQDSFWIGSKQVGIFPVSVGPDREKARLLIYNQDNCNTHEIITQVPWAKKVTLSQVSDSEFDVTTYLDDPLCQPDITYRFNLDGILLSSTEKPCEEKPINYSNTEYGFEIQSVNQLTSQREPKINIMQHLAVFDFGSFSIINGHLFDKQGKPYSYDQLANLYLNKFGGTKSGFLYNGRQALRLTFTQQKKGALDHPDEVIISENDHKIFIIESYDPSLTDKIITSLKYQYSEFKQDNIRWLYPQPKQTIKSSLPTIIVKIRQTETIYLSVDFNMRNTPEDGWSGRKRYYLDFNSGKVSNINALIDDSRDVIIWGIPQFPSVRCDNEALNYPVGSLESLNDWFYADSVHAEPFSTKEECIKQKVDELPPLILFIKPNYLLDNGQHTLRLQTNDNYEYKLIFDIGEPDIDIPVWNNLSEDSQEQIDWNQYDSNNCADGYYHPKSYMHAPLVKIENRDLTYKMNFPQSNDELIKPNPEHDIVLMYNNQKFDFRLPQADIFYFTDELDNNMNLSDPYKALFLPKSNIYFTDGTKAETWQPGGRSIEIDLINIIPISTNNIEYFQEKLRWNNSAFSGCDG